MSEISFKRKSEYINNRYPNANDEFKAKMLLKICEKDVKKE